MVSNILLRIPLFRKVVCSNFYVWIPCMDTLTDRIPTPKKSPFWYALWVYTNKRLFYMGN